ncbi:MAG TPA: type II toxin-antitoxin system HipA family toxin [Terriglobales bacterium]|nr:type II toxin-antitoxin system HipA family toxin [Terriglobales bacterium]
MRLHVYVLGELIAILEQDGDFRSVLTYVHNAPLESLVSLTMVVRTESYAWNDQLPPVFQMNLPEGYLLQVLQEEFGPHVGASPVALLAVIGRNMVGRMQVAPPEAKLDQPAKPIEVASLLQGDNSEEAFTQLVREHAVSGVSGVLPKFLDTEKTTRKFGAHQKATLLTHRHIIKGSSARIPFATLNEYLCMQVVGKIVRSAKTELSQDGNVLVVHRFDVGPDGNPFWAMEDFCALLGLRPSAKYETTWERIARAVRELTPGDSHSDTFDSLTAMLLLTYALRNADCHSKNLALLYSSQDDAHLAPAYDFLTTSVYAGYQNNPPGISFMGKKTWLPGKNLSRFITATFGMPPREQVEMVERISDAVADVAPNVLEMTRRFPKFKDTGKRMLAAWNEGVTQLRDTRVYAMPAWRSPKVFQGLSDAPKLERPRTKIGRSPLLADRSKKRKVAR